MDLPPLPRALRPYVAMRHAYDADLGGPGVHRGLPSPTLTFVLPIDDQLRVGWAAGGDGDVRAAWSCLSGLHTAPAAIHHDGRQRGIQLALTVAGARRLLGRPAADLVGAFADLDEALPELAELPERLHEQASWSARVALVDRNLAQLLARAGEPGVRAEVGHALGRLTRGRRVADVAEEVGYSRRRLTDLVRGECGVTPKEYQRLARFDRSRWLLGRGSTIAEVAAASGYADHAHLVRDWRDLAGCTPSTWLREEFPFVQDPPGAGGSDSEHD